MAPQRSSLAERIRRRRARLVTGAPIPPRSETPAGGAPPPAETSAPPAEFAAPPAGVRSAAPPAVPADPYGEDTYGEDKNIRLARARELIRRTERGWKELRTGSAPERLGARAHTPEDHSWSGVREPPHAWGSRAEAYPAVEDGAIAEAPKEPFSRSDHDYPLTDRYGGETLGRLLEAREEATRRLQLRPETPGVDLSRAVFLDTETSGLAGGTGTFAFLVGIGRVAEDCFRVTQFLLRDPGQERAMLEDLTAAVEGRDLVTYNGSSFDLPLLEARFALNGLSCPFRAVGHLDLLHPARRLFKPRHETARLGVLEREVLEVERDDDIPGDQIPQVFFHFLRHGDHPAMDSVLSHNRYDIVTLAALALRAAERVAEDWHSDDPSDLHGAGHHLWRRGESEAAIPLLERALSAGLSGRNRDRCLLDLGERRKQLGDWEGALVLWRRVSTDDSRERLDALVWFAKHEEHHRKDPARALTHVEDAIERLPRVELGDETSVRYRKELDRRAARLVKSLG